MVTLNPFTSLFIKAMRMFLEAFIHLSMFGGKVPLRPAQVKAGAKPYLSARVY
jgi:hypothetical protein